MAWFRFAATICGSRCHAPAWLGGSTAACHGGTKVLGVFGSLADSLGGDAGGALGEFVNLARTVVGCGREGHGCGDWLCLVGERFGAGGEHVAEVVGCRHNEARCGSGVLDERGGLVGRVIGHL